MLTQCSVKPSLELNLPLQAKNRPHFLCFTMTEPIAAPTETSAPQTPKGVMAADYAEDRTRKPHLVFRYRCRAMIAARMFRRFAGGASASRVVDFGAADGRAMIEAHKLLESTWTVGIEWSPELIHCAPEMPFGCHLAQGDVTKPHPKVEAGTFDLVTALAVFEHIAKPEELATRAAEALKPGGLMIATCPSGVWDRISGAVGLHKDEYHEGEFHKARFEQVARAGGLEPVCYQRFMFAPIGVLPYAKIPVSPAFALAVDRVLAPIPLLNLAMVNQVFVARKPSPRGAERS